MRPIHNALSYGRRNKGFGDRDKKIPSCHVLQVPPRVPLDPHFKSVQRTDVEHMEEHDHRPSVALAKGCVRVTQFVDVVNSTFATVVVFDGYGTSTAEVAAAQ